MAQLHLYLPEDLAEKVRQRAASRRQSVSDYLAELVRGQIADAWPEGYFENVVGGIREAFDAGELPWTKRGRSFPSRLPKRKPSGSKKRERFRIEISKKKCGVTMDAVPVNSQR